MTSSTTPSQRQPKKQINFHRGWPNPSLLPISALQEASKSVLSNPDIAVPGLCYGADAGFFPLRESIGGLLSSFYSSSPSSSSSSSTSVNQGKSAESEKRSEESREEERFQETVDRKAKAEKICITGGASQNLACVLQVYTDPKFTEKVWMVAPTYFLACSIFEDAGLGMRAVGEDRVGDGEGGEEWEWLEGEMGRVEREEGMGEDTIKPHRPYSKYYRHIIYLVPTFSNPTGKSLTLSQRTSLIQLARRHDALIVTDDVYDFLYWPSSPPSPSENQKEAKPLPRLIDIDAHLPYQDSENPPDGFANTMSNGSFSKLLGPGTRTGWAASPSEKFIYGLSQCGSSTSGGAPSQIVATFINELIRNGGFEKHVSWLRGEYARRWKVTREAVVGELVPLGVKIEGDGGAGKEGGEIKGGYFMWLKLPGGMEGRDVVKRAKEEENLIVSPGDIFEVRGDEEAARFGGFLRLCWSWEDEEVLVEGVERLGRVIEKILKEGS